MWEVLGTMPSPGAHSANDSLSFPFSLFGSCPSFLVCLFSPASILPRSLSRLPTFFLRFYRVRDCQVMDPSPLILQTTTLGPRGKVTFPSLRSM